MTEAKQIKVKLIAVAVAAVWSTGVWADVTGTIDNGGVPGTPVLSGESVTLTGAAINNTDVTFDDGAGATTTITNQLISIDDGAGQTVSIDQTSVTVSGTGSVSMSGSGDIDASGLVSAGSYGGTGGLTGTTMTLNNSGFVFTDPAHGNTFAVSGTADATLGNATQAGSLSISNGAGGNHTVLNGTANSITGTTSTAISGGGTTLTVSSTGASLGGARMTNMADGVAATDAVTVQQMNAATTALDGRIDKVSERAYGGIASVAALAAIPVPTQGKQYTVGAGVGNYGGENALAIGFRGALTPSVSVSLGVSHNTASKTAANAGIGYSW